MKKVLGTVAAAALFATGGAGIQSVSASEELAAGAMVATERINHSDVDAATAEAIRYLIKQQQNGVKRVQLKATGSVGTVKRNQDKVLITGGAEAFTL